MGCCEDIDLQSNNVKGAKLVLGVYKHVSDLNVSSTSYPVYQSPKGSDTLVFTPKGEFWRVSCQFN